MTGKTHWVLARRSLTDPTETAYYVCYGPVHRLRDLARVAGARWQVEVCFQAAKTSAAWTATRSAAMTPSVLSR